MWWYGRSSRENYLLRIFRLGFRLRRIFKLPPLRSRAKYEQVWQSVVKQGKVWQVWAKYEQVWQVQGQVWQASFDCSHHNVMAVAQQSLLSQGWKMPFAFPTGNMGCCAGFSFVKRQKSHFIFRYNP